LYCYAHCFILVNVTTEIKPDRLVIHSFLRGFGRQFLTVFNIYNVGVPIATNAYTPRALLLATGPTFSTRYLEDIF
jgi:hypothetical protein